MANEGGLNNLNAGNRHPVAAINKNLKIN